FERSENFSTSYGTHNVIKDGVGLFGEVNGEIAFLHRIYVEENDRKNGYATQMFEKFESFARSKGCKVIRVALERGVGRLENNILKSYGFHLTEGNVFEKNI
ncbi:MAG TPA: hypothetical protein DCE80_06445, partial [Ignavibacteriales bacterium]|nr:hypothetical protein [Ignavibacteriales bacterium]